VADQKILEDSLRETMIFWYDGLQEFNKACHENVGYQFWPPMDYVVARWKQKHLPDHEILEPL
jgi:hypothetical protein